MWDRSLEVLKENNHEKLNDLVGKTMLELCIGCPDSVQRRRW
jgi:hypothetical protein